MTTPAPARHGRPWSAADLRVLVYRWDDLETPALAALLGRRPSAVVQQGRLQGLRTRQGRATLSAAAATAGVDVGVLRRMVLRRELRARRGHAAGDTARPHRYVDVDAVAAAVARYVAGETCRAAAARRGRPAAWLRRRLVAAGVYVAAYGHRYPDAVVDAAVAAYRAPARTRDAAGRYVAPVAPVAPVKPTRGRGRTPR